MRTSINLDDDVHRFAAMYANARGITLSAAISELIRKAESAPASAPELHRSASGLPMFPPTGRTITDKIVKEIEGEEFDPEKPA